MLKTLLALLALAFAVAAPSGASAQVWPSKPVRIIVPFASGGAADLLPRLIAPKLAELWSQPVVVENRTGAAGNIGMEQGAKSPPDGYTLTSAPVGNLSINPHIYAKMPYDVFRDFALVSLIATVDNVFVVPVASPLQGLPDFVAYAKANPGKLTFGSGGVGSQAHMGGELLKVVSGIDMQHIAYKGVAESMRDLLGGQISIVCAQLPAASALINGGKLRALGIASAKRSPVLPNVPTVNEALGVKDFEAISWYTLAAPAGLPREIASKIGADVARVVQMPEIREKMLGMGAEPIGGSPEQAAALMKKDYDRYGAIVKRFGIKAD